MAEYLSRPLDQPDINLAAIRGGSATSTDTLPALMSITALRKSSEIIRRSTGIRKGEAERCGRL